MNAIQAESKLTFEELEEAAPVGEELQENGLEEAAPVSEELHVPRTEFEFENEQEPDAQGEVQAEVQASDEYLGEIVDETVTRSGRVVKPLKDPDYVYATQMDEKEAEKAAERAEILQLFVEKEVLQAVHAFDVKKRKLLRAFMFSKRKVNADGSFDKFKSRLVGDGRGQRVWDDMKSSSSPTAEFTDVLMALKFAACKNHDWMKIDIKGAYLNANLDEEVYVILDKKTTALTLEVLPELKKYVGMNNQLTAKVKKALYGLVQSARLWYEEIKKVLVDYGFAEIKKCVFKKGESVVILYVDDLLVIGSHGFLEEVKDLMVTEFKEVTYENGDTIDYLGMQLIRMEKEIHIRMDGYIKELMECFEVFRKSIEHPIKVKGLVPAGKEIFKQKALQSKINNVDGFHSLVAKLLYLSKRARPDISLAVSFLATRVGCPVQMDVVKLNRVMEYLKVTHGKPLIVSFENASDLELNCYVDASFSAHPDGKGHSGVAIFVGESMVHSSSKKQKICAKDSTEAELIALSDNVVIFDRVKDLYTKIFGEEPMVNVYQDNQSLITLVMNDDMKEQRTKHLNARLACVRENGMKLTYIKTDEMIADILTKGIVGKQYHILCDGLMGTKMVSRAGIASVKTKERKKKESDETKATRVRWSHTKNDHGQLTAVSSSGRSYASGRG
jgi:hypothetical protein